MMGFPSQRVETVVRWVAGHPKTTVRETEDHCIDGADLDGVRGAIAQAVRAGLVDRSVMADPMYLICTAKGFRALE
jgi:hypothetical protein